MSPRLALLPLLLLGACATQNCDPATAGFLTGIGCAGAFEQQDRAKEQQLQDARRNLAVQRAAADAAARDRAAAEADLAGMRAKLADIEQQDADLRQRLAAARRRQGADTAALQRAQHDLDALEASVHRAAAAPDPATVQDLQRRHDAVLDAIINGS